jgi:iturin family lipopeptide synthetase A
MSTKKNSVLDNLKTVIAGVYETDNSEVDTQVSFLEMGMDSISIIQVKQLVKNSYGFEVPVDRLFSDIANLDKLADFIVTQMPADIPAPAVAPAGTVENTVKASNIAPFTSPAKKAPVVVSTGIQQIINEQLQVMQRQMEVLSAMAQQ